MKKFLAVLLMICLIIPAAAVSATADTPAWAELYRTFITNKSYLGTAEAAYFEGGDEPVSFALHDMDEDGTPELVVFNGGESEADAAFYLYRVSAGTVKYVDVLGGRLESQFRYSQTGNYPGLFFDYVGNNGMSSTTYQYMTGGKLYTEEIESTTNGFTTRVTTDDDLYNANSEAQTVLNFSTLSEIEVMGWSEFTGVEGMDDENDASDYTVYTDNGKYKYVVVTGNSLNVRSEPYPTAFRKAVVTKGTTLKYQNMYAIDGNGTKWYCVSYNSQSLWMAATYSKRTNESGSTSAKYIYITGDSVYVRTYADIDSDALGTAHKGDRYTYAGKSSTDDRGVKWYAIKFNGQTGWVSSKWSSTKQSSDPSTTYIYVTGGSAYLRASADKDSKAITTVHKGDKLVYAGKTSTDDRGVKWYAVTYNGKTRWISSKVASTKKSSSGGGSSSVSYIYVTGGSAYLRKSADKDSKAVTTVHKGDKLTYAGKTSTDDRGVKWYAVTYNGSTCWISSKVASTKKSSSGGGSSSSTVVCITGSSVNVRASADKSSKTLGTVHEGDTLDYQGSTSTDDRGVKWYKVTYKNKTGWVSSKMAKLK